MLALRRASIPLRYPLFCRARLLSTISRSAVANFRLRGLAAATSIWGAVHPSSTSGASEGNANNFHNVNASPDLILISTSYASIWKRGFASQAESDNEIVSELEASSEKSHEDHDLDSESDLFDDEENKAFSAFEGEIDDHLDKSSSNKRRPPPEIFSYIISIPRMSTKATLDQLIKEGKHINETIIRDTVYHLRRRGMFGRALEVLNWFAANKNMTLSEADCTGYIDIISRVQGIVKAEEHIRKNSEKFNTETVYRTLLANSVRAGNVKKCEDIFNYMKTHFKISSFACTQMILLYKRFDRLRIPEMLNLMEKLKLKRSLFTYAVLVDSKGAAKDIAGMEELMAAMNADGVEPNGHFLSVVACHYINNGRKEKAEEFLKQMEEMRANGERWLGRKLLLIYGNMGRVEEVSRIWSECESEANAGEYRAAIKAWGLVGDVAKAEEVFNSMTEKFERVSGIQYICLLEVYASRKMVEEGKKLIQRMTDAGVRLGPGMVNAMVELYAKAGDVEKADVALSSFIWETRGRPRFHTFMTLMEAYASKGDVHNAEKVFRRMKQCSYSTSSRVFYKLLQAYVNSDTPAYGIKERMIADGVFPSKIMAAQLKKVEPFKWGTIPQLY